MRAQGLPSFARTGLVLASVLVLLPLLGACTKGGQFDPTEMFNSDVFDAKKKLSGQRVPVFPGGVPGTQTGVPADLVKGYQAPPDQNDADASQAPPPGAEAAQAPPKTASAEPAATAEPKPKKVRPKPKVASAPAQSQPQSQDPVWNQTQAGPARSGPTRISVGPKAGAPAQGASQDQGAASQTNWPAPQATSAQTNWPAAPPTTTPAQRVQQDWPSSSSNAPAQKATQPSQ
ncbi:MAG TPA: hypothetical protein VHU22_10840 [Xanthobacteraceae bacterium]|jgi:hypothetical protein|nr:hypothetical protein [Xanthobacteraceae bacterium]